MAGLFTTMLSMASAGVMMLSTAVDTAAPQHDVEGTLFLANREWRLSENYVP